MSEKSLRILVVHSSAELYGSDRSLLDFVRHHDRCTQITVAIPEYGILVNELESAGATVIVGEVCKIQRSMNTPFGWVKSLYAALQSVRFLGSVRPKNGFDLVYSNTVAVLGGALSARIWGVPHIWHVRELMPGSRIQTAIFRFLVAKLSTKVICNSGQTLDWIKSTAAAEKYEVIWNGFDAPIGATDRSAERARLGATDDDVLFVLVGRINGWKGQQLLVDAFSQLVSETKQRSRLAIVGSAPPNQEHYERELKVVVANSGRANRITLVPYRPDINSVWLAADVVVVPSTEPEPFGRVAIEAMGFCRPVIAAAHGGLVEIVEDGVTGLLFEPRNTRSLAKAMATLMHDAGLRRQMGERGRVRQRDFFSLAGYASKLNEVMRKTSVRRPITVLFVHQSAEMYGSDKVLLWLALGMKTQGIYPIVLLPMEGPLTLALKAGGVETHTVNVLKLDRETLSAKGLLTAAVKFFSSMRTMHRALAGRQVDVVYSNTLAVFGASIWAKFHRTPHVWHVHELLMSPRIVRQGFPWLLRLLADRVICNSTMTEQWILNEQPSLAGRTVVIWNGLGPRPPVRRNVAADLRAGLKIPDGHLLVALVGRINLWKGQELLIDAAAVLWGRGFRDVDYLIVGGVAPKQEHLVEQLKLKIANSVVRERTHIMPFTDDVWGVWDACDIAVVPSTKPEPFGLVAIEAMAAMKPVVVAAHGGLLDIVEHGVSGLLFQPGDATLFADELEKLIASPTLRNQLGMAGCARQEKLFSLNTQLDRTAEVLHELAPMKHYANGH